jgi:hypothetical protein
VTIVGRFAGVEDGPRPHSPNETRDRLPSVDTHWHYHSTFTHADDNRLRRIPTQEQRPTQSICFELILVSNGGWLQVRL